MLFIKFIRNKVIFGHIVNYILISFSQLLHILLRIFLQICLQIWRALLRKMPLTAMIRNLGRMTSIGLLTGNNEETTNICNKLRDETVLAKARIHPFNVLVALKIYMDGHGERGSLTWEPNELIAEALESAFYLSFKV